MSGHGRVPTSKTDLLPSANGDPFGQRDSALGFWKAIEEVFLSNSASRLFVRRAHFGRTDEVTRIFSSAPTLAMVAHLGATNIDRPNAGGHQMPAR
jgi:hypothetical protein